MASFRCVCFVNRHGGCLHSGLLTEVSFKEGVSMANYGGSLRYAQAPSQQEAETLTQGVTNISRICFLQLSVKVSKTAPFAHTPLRHAESAEFSSHSFHTDCALGSRCSSRTIVSSSTPNSCGSKHWQPEPRISPCPSAGERERSPVGCG